MPRILTPNDVANFRNRLCETASELFAEVGQSGFNMRELAKRLNVSAMTPYRYFDDKDAILSEVRARAFGRFADWLEEQRTGESDALARAYAQFAIQQQTQYRLMFDLGQPQPGLLPALLKQERRARAALVGYARDLVERQALGHDPDLLGLVLWSALHGVATLYLTGKLSSREFDEVLSLTVAMLGENGVHRPHLSRPETGAGSPLSDNMFAADQFADSSSAMIAG